MAQELEALRLGLDLYGLRFAGTLRLGPQGPERAEPPVLNLPALEASGLGLPLRVGGLFPWFFRGASARDGWAMRLEAGREFPAYLLKAWAAAAEVPESLQFLRGPARAFVRDPKKKGPGEWRDLPAFDADKARAILRDLLSDYLNAAGGEGHLDDLPLARIEGVLKDAGQDADAVRDWPQALLDARRAQEETQGTRRSAREKLLRAIDPSVPVDAADAIRRRILPFLEWKRALYAGAVNESGEPA